MAVQTIYDEVANFIAGMNPHKVIEFKPTETNQNRFDLLIDKNLEEGLTLEEKVEIEHSLILNRIIGLAKAKALNLISL